MKKISTLIAVLFLVCAAILAVWQFSNWQNNNSQSRYYTGIGVQLYRVEAKVGMVGSSGQLYLNEDGHLDGLILIRNILEDGPAARAGLRDMDVVLEFNGKKVDGKEIHAWSVWGIENAIIGGKEGEPVHLRVRRIDTKGDTLGELEVDVRREKIDKVAWLSMGIWLTTRTANCGGGGCDRDVSFASMVQETTGGKFVYSYKVTNSGRKTVMVNWGALKKIGLGSDFIVEPGQAKEMAFRLDEFPTESGEDVKFREKWSSLAELWYSLTVIGTTKLTASAFVPASQVKQPHSGL